MNRNGHITRIMLRLGTLSLGLALAGCVADNPLSEGETLSFEAEVTKVRPVDLAGLKAHASPIAVNCFLLNHPEVPTSAERYFSEDLIWKNKKWDTDPPQLWPRTTVGSTPTEALSFYLYHPMGADGLSFSDADYLLNINQKPTLSYTVASTAARQIDLLAAEEEKVVHGTHIYNTGSVILSFHHLLSQIRFQAKGDMSDLVYHITALSIGQSYDNTVPAECILGQGTYTFGGQMVANSLGDKASYNYPLRSVPFKISSATTAIELGATNLSSALMLMPQTITTSPVGTNDATDPSIYITYWVTKTDLTTMVYGSEETPVTRRMKLPNATVWESGNCYTYVLTLPSEERPALNFSVSVNPWGEDSEDMNLSDPIISLTETNATTIANAISAHNSVKGNYETSEYFVIESFGLLDGTTLDLATARPSLSNFTYRDVIELQLKGSVAAPTEIIAPEWWHIASSTPALTSSASVTTSGCSLFLQKADYFTEKANTTAIADINVAIASHNETKALYPQVTNFIVEIENNPQGIALDFTAYPPDTSHFVSGDAIGLYFSSIAFTPTTITAPSGWMGSLDEETWSHTITISEQGAVHLRKE